MSAGKNHEKDKPGWLGNYNGYFELGGQKGPTWRGFI